MFSKETFPSEDANAWKRSDRVEVELKEITSNAKHCAQIWSAMKWKPLRWLYLSHFNVWFSGWIPNNRQANVGKSVKIICSDSFLLIQFFFGCFCCCQPTVAIAALHQSEMHLLSRGWIKKHKRRILLLRVRFFYIHRSICAMVYGTLCFAWIEFGLLFHWIGGACTCLHFFTFSFHVKSELQRQRERPINFNCIYPYLLFTLDHVFHIFFRCCCCWARTSKNNR